MLLTFDDCCQTQNFSLIFANNFDNISGRPLYGWIIIICGHCTCDIERYTKLEKIHRFPCNSSFSSYQLMTHVELWPYHLSFLSSHFLSTKPCPKSLVPKASTYIDTWQWYLSLFADQKEHFTARNMVLLKSSTHMQQTRLFTLRQRLMVSYFDHQVNLGDTNH